MKKSALRLVPSKVKVGARRILNDYEVYSRHKATRQQIARAALEISNECLKGINNYKDWQRRRCALRKQLMYMLAIRTPPERTPLNAQITGVIERPRCRIEKVVFESLPGLYVTANYYLPNEHQSSLPCIVYLNGHSPSLDGAKTIYQAPSLWYAANGFALLVIDPLGFGEIPGVHHGMNRLNQWHWLSDGYTPAGVEVWNAMRALDWLETRLEVDASRIGVTGISGGGVVTQYLAALDDRVAVAAPSCSTFTIGTQVAMDIVPHQCDCTYYPNVFQLDLPEVLALIAPRPLLILGGRKDYLFPPAGFREAFMRVKKIYDLFDEPDNGEPRIRLVESGQGHIDTPQFLNETHKWMCRWLREPSEMNGEEEAPSLHLEQPGILRCLDKPPPNAINYHVHDAWIRRSSQAIPQNYEIWSRRRENLVNQIRTRIFSWFPNNKIPFNTRRINARGRYAAEFADYGEYEFDSEAGTPIRAGLLKPLEQIDSVPLIVWIKEAIEHVAFPDIDEFHPILRTHSLLIMTPRFADRPLSGYEMARIERAAALVGRSIAAMQVWHVLRAVAWAIRDRGLVPSKIAVYGRCNAGIVGLYAAVLDQSIGQVILRNPPTTHLDGPALPTILRDTDIEEVAGMLAPRRLTLIASRNEELLLTRSIYDLLGVGAEFRSAKSIAEATLS